MGYVLIRILIFIAVAICLCVLNIKVKLSKLKKFICLFIALVFCTVISIFPVENVFVDFNSAEEAFVYARRGDIVSICENDKSNAILFRNGDTYSTFFLNKSESDYKLCSPFDTIQIAEITKDSITIYLYKLRGTSDFYLEIFGLTSSEIVLTDNLETDFELIYQDFSNMKIVNGLFSVNYEETYKLYLNGVLIDLDN